MEFRQLQHFLAAARHGTLHAAAEAAGLSQPALTKSIRRLEHQLGATLFERHPRGVRLTAYGEALALHAAALEAELRHAEDALRTLRLTARGLVRVGAGPSMGTTLLPAVAARLLAQGPAVQLQIRSGLNDTLLSWLQRGELDFAITTMPAQPISPAVAHERLFIDQVVISARQNHPLAGRRVPLTALADARWVLPNREVLTRVRLEELFAEHGLGKPDIRIETDSFPFTLETIRSTDVLGYLPNQLLTRHSLIALNVPGATWQRRVSLSYWRGRAATPASRLFRDILQQITSELYRD
jgi:DNA-binding transcriptional LysR family regulator